MEETHHVRESVPLNYLILSSHMRNGIDLDPQLNMQIVNLQVQIQVEKR